MFEVWNCLEAWAYVECWFFVSIMETAVSCCAGRLRASLHGGKKVAYSAGAKRKSEIARSNC